MFMTISQPTWIRRETTRDESHTSFQCGIHERRWRSSNGNSWQSQTVLFLLLISVSGSCSLDRSLYLVLLLICRTQQNCSYRRNSCSKRRSLSCFSLCCPKTLSSKTLLSRTSYKVSLVASLIANHRLSRCSTINDYDATYLFIETWTTRKKTRVPGRTNVFLFQSDWTNCVPWQKPQSTYRYHCRHALTM